MMEEADKGARALPYYKWFWQDWRANRIVQRMTYIQKGLYRELLDECWAEGSIPDDVSELAFICNCPVEVMADAWQVLSKCFEGAANGRLVNERLERERTEKDRQRLVRAEAGKKGGIAKSLNSKESLPSTVASASTCQANPSNCHIEEERREEERREEEFPPADLLEPPSAPVKQPAAKPKKAKEPKDPKDEAEETAYQAAARATWNAYAEAYTARYGARPVRNATVNSKLKQFIQRIGYEESPMVAAYFVTIKDAYLIRRCHSVGDLLASAESYRMQWATNRQQNGTAARQEERTGANISAAQLAKQRLRERDNVDA